MIILLFVTLVSLALTLTLVFGLYRTILTQTSKDQALFLSGSVPRDMPDGLYKGQVPGHTFTWQGKKFDAKTNTGINVFKDNGEIHDNYPFTFYKTKGLQDTNLDVIRIYYNLPQNPLWLRFVVDEIVEIKPGKYLGKLHINVFGIDAALGYFELEK